MDLGDQLFKMCNDMNKIRQSMLPKCQHCSKYAQPNKRFCTFHLAEHRENNKGTDWVEKGEI